MSHLPSETEDRLIALVIGAGLTIDAARRTMATGSDGSEPVKVSRNGADRVIRDARLRTGADDDPATVAARLLRLLSLELAAIEAQTGPKDLDRLQKLASTLGTIERLRPKPRTEPESLLSLQDEPAQNGQK